jgi:hypothetical protein
MCGDTQFTAERRQADPERTGDSLYAYNNPAYQDCQEGQPKKWIRQSGGQRFEIIIYYFTG